MESHKQIKKALEENDGVSWRPGCPPVHQPASPPARWASCLPFNIIVVITIIMKDYCYLPLLVVSLVLV